MWHETQEDMELLLHSVLEKVFLEIKNLFDDAFNNNGCVNRYVLQLFAAMDSVHGKIKRQPTIPDIKNATYGGINTWQLNGKNGPKGTKVVCHLKDQKKEKVELMYVF